MPSLIEQFVQQYEPHVDFYAKVAALVATRCRTALERHHIPAVVTSRAKRPENLRKKLQKRKSFRNYAAESDMLIDAMDLAGVRIALYLPFQEGHVMKLLEEVFVVRDLKIHGDIAYRPQGGSGGGSADKRVVSEHRPSGYRAIHTHVELGQQLEGFTAPEDQRRYCSTLAEIQITSLLMHVWSEVEHRLVYKAEFGQAAACEMRVLEELYGSIRTAETLLSQLRRSVLGGSQRPDLIDAKAKL